MSTARWEHFEHVADIGVRGIGETLAEAFEQAALAMTAAVTDPACVAPLCAVEIHCENADPEFLFVDWLNAVIYEMAVRSMLFASFRVCISGPVLRATISGEPVDRDRHHPAVEIKGATFTELRVMQQESRWIAQCVIDV